MSQNLAFTTHQKKKTLKRRIPTLHVKDIPHPTETPKEKNFDMKRETPIHVNSHPKSQINPINMNQASKFNTHTSKPRTGVKIIHNLTNI